MGETTGLVAETDRDLTVADSEEITKLQKQVETLNQELQKTEELNNRLESEVTRLKAENQKLQKQQVTQEIPDYETVRDRVLNKLKLGKQSTVGKALGEFIKELQKLPMPDAPGKADKLPKVTQVQPVTWESRADDFLKEVAGNA